MFFDKENSMIYRGFNLAKLNPELSKIKSAIDHAIFFDKENSMIYRGFNLAKLWIVVNCCLADSCGPEKVYSNGF